MVAKFITNINPKVNCTNTKSTVKGANPIDLVYANKFIVSPSNSPIKLPATDPINKNSMTTIKFEFLLTIFPTL